jgi:hypothetical protein
VNVASVFLYLFLFLFSFFFIFFLFIFIFIFFLFFFFFFFCFVSVAFGFLLFHSVELSGGAKSNMIDISGGPKKPPNLQFEIIDGNRGTKRLGLATFGDMTLAAVCEMSSNGFPIFLSYRLCAFDCFFA